MSEEKQTVQKNQSTLSFDPLVNGSNFTKMCGTSKPHPRNVKVSLERHVIYWKSPRKSESKTTIPFSDIKEIREGHKTKRFSKADPALEDRSFSIIYGGKFKTLDLVAENKDVRDIWVGSLRELVATQNADPIKVFLQQAWKKADKNGDNQLDLEEVLKLLKSLNVSLTKGQIKASFNEVKGEKGTLDFEGFTKFYKNLKYRKEIEHIFADIAKENPAKASIAELKKFLTEVQKVPDVTDEQINELIKKHGIDEFSKDGGLSLEGFNHFLTAESGIWKKSFQAVYQDMSRPLTHYWINSSHNTYLLQDQLKGPSSTEAYIRAFQLGCRCVELDCWDGPDGNPIVFHGHTLTSKILFEDVIKVCKQYAFAASDYPIILSLEVHTGIEQQTRMAEIMKKELGDLIWTTPLPDDADFLPSPESLKGKILIKGKTLPKGAKPDEYDTEDESDDGEEEPEEVKQMKEKEGKKKGSKVKVSQELSDMVTYCKTAHFKTFEDSKEKGKPDQMSSFVEGKSEKLCSTQRDKFIEYNRKQLSRIYPAGGRVDSSNYAPHLHWNAGCQIVAFNFQTLDRTMQLNLGKFANNGGAGYVLKPEWMLKDGAPRAPAKKLTITIISAQQLPKPGQSTKGEIIDPYVEIDVCGEESDCVSKKTKVIDDNGFNPRWDETFEFSVKAPEVTLVRFVVYDKDVNSDDFVASASFAFEAIEEGYRHIKLKDSKNTVMDLSTLFVKISVSDA